MKWIMALNESNNNIYNNSEKYEKFALVAIHSALKNAPGLESYLIYNGAPSLFTEKVINLGSRVIFHKLSFQDEIEAQENRDGIWKQIAKGAMLRLDIPDIFEIDQTVLYTDTDVMFLSDPSKYLLESSSFAAGPEFDINNFHKINTGSMLINLKNCRKSFKDLRNWMINNLDWIPDYDQGAIQHYFDGKWDRLDPRMNWKPYWGVKDNAIIIHFHGPKPLDFEKISKTPCFKEGIYDLLYKSNPTGYDYYLSHWFDLHNEYNEKFIEP